MKVNVDVEKDKWFVYKEHRHLAKDMRFIVMTGARGCGKTVSCNGEIRDHFRKKDIGLYVRNSRTELSSARQYFNFLAVEKGEGWEIGLGTMGAGSVTLINRETGDCELIAYTLSIIEFEKLKSSKKKLDYVIYEEFSTFSGGQSINRVFALIEIIETISQTNPNFLFYALSNNIFEDDLFDNLLADDEFIHFIITRPTARTNVKNKTIKAYLEGDFLVPDVTINLTHYAPLGYVEVANSRIYIFYDEYSFPQYVISSTGKGSKLRIDTDVLDMVKRASYRSLKDRNKCEFLVGLLRFAGNKLKV